MTQAIDDQQPPGKPAAPGVPKEPAAPDVLAELEERAFLHDDPAAYEAGVRDALFVFAERRSRTRN